MQVLKIQDKNTGEFINIQFRVEQKDRADAACSALNYSRHMTDSLVVVEVDGESGLDMLRKKAIEDIKKIDNGTYDFGEAVSGDDYWMVSADET